MVRVQTKATMQLKHRDRDYGTVQTSNNNEALREQQLSRRVSYQEEGRLSLIFLVSRRSWCF